MFFSNLFLFGFLFFLLGAIIGSFLNVVILRYGSGMNIKGRSQCFSCGKKLLWYELIPILSFVFIRGRCRGCKSSIAIQYPLVEVFTGILFVLTFLKFSNFLSPYYIPYTAYYLLIWSLLIIIFVYDFRHKIIPDGIVYSFALLTLGLLLVQGIMSGAILTTPFLLRVINGPLLFIPFFLLWFLSRGTWMGFGDAKLALGIGFMFDFSQSFAVLLLSFWIGAVVGVGLILVPKLQKGVFMRNNPLPNALKGLTIKSEIPFAPFLIFAVFIEFFFALDIIKVFSRLIS